MKTPVIMQRSMMGLPVRQNSKTGMFNVNDIHEIGNAHRKTIGLPKKILSAYFVLDSTTELINEICIEENIQAKDVKISKRGGGGGTWVHPVLFVDLVMWYSPRLKAKIIRWVIDGLLSARNESGDSFKDMNSALTQNFPTEFNSPLSYTKVANQVSRACGVCDAKDKWQKATEKQLKLRKKIQENVCMLADVMPNAGSCISKAIEKAVVTERKSLANNRQR